jgi:hypothetical protein
MPGGRYRNQMIYVNRIAEVVARESVRTLGNSRLRFPPNRRP